MIKIVFKIEPVTNYKAVAMAALLTKRGIDAALSALTLPPAVSLEDPRVSLCKSTHTFATHTL